jgi:hypothetical protein
MKTLDFKEAEELGIDPEAADYLATEKDVVHLGSILECPDCNQQFVLKEEGVIRIYLPKEQRYVRWIKIAQETDPAPIGHSGHSGAEEESRDLWQEDK